jgi:hypothetical protein
VHVSGRPHAPADVSSGNHGHALGRFYVAIKPLCGAEDRMGFGSGYYSLHSILRHLDHATQALHSSHNQRHVHSREQRNAVYPLLGLLHRRNNGLCGCRISHSDRPSHGLLGASCLDILPGSSGRHDDHPHEAADDQYRAAALSLRGSRRHYIKEPSPERRGGGASGTSALLCRRCGNGDRVDEGCHVHHRSKVQPACTNGHPFSEH